MFRFAGITRKGFELLSEATAGKKLSFTRMEYGDGIIAGLQNVVADEESLLAYNELLTDNPTATEEEILACLKTEETDIAIKTLFLDLTELVSKQAEIGM